MQQKEARLRRNDDPDLVIDFQLAATLESLLIQKDLDMPAHLGLILRCQPMVIGDVPFQNLQPCPRKRTGTNFGTAFYSIRTILFLLFIRSFFFTEKGEDQRLYTKGI